MKQFYENRNDQELESQRKEASKRLLKAFNEEQAMRKQIFLKVLMFVLLFVILFKLLIGTIELKNGFPNKKNHLYDVMINNQIMMVDVAFQSRIPIIPFFVYLNRKDSDVFYGKEGENHNILPSDQYLLNIDSYHCYSKSGNVRIACNSSNNFSQILDENRIYDLYIRKNGKKETVLYDGKFISDITAYIKAAGNYYIEIRNKQGFNSSKIMFTIHIED